MGHKHRTHRLSSGVFLIGLALLLLTGWWFPGILFVIGASIFAGAIDQGKPLQSATPAFFFFGIGLVFGFPGIIHGINWKLIGIVVLVVFAWSVLFSKKPQPPAEDDYDDEYRDDDDDDESDYV